MSRRRARDRTRQAAQTEEQHQVLLQVRREILEFVSAAANEIML